MWSTNDLPVVRIESFITASQRVLVPTAGLNYWWKKSQLTFDLKWPLRLLISQTITAIPKIVMKITLQRSCWSQRCENGPVPKKSSHLISGCLFSTVSHLVDTFANNTIAGLFSSIVAMKIRSTIGKLYRVSIVWKLGFNRVCILFLYSPKIGRKKELRAKCIIFWAV